MSIHFVPIQILQPDTGSEETFPSLPQGNRLPPACRCGAAQARHPRFPFVPDDAARLREDCYEAYNIQA